MATLQDLIAQATTEIEHVKAWIESEFDVADEEIRAHVTRLETALSHLGTAHQAAADTSANPGPAATGTAPTATTSTVTTPEQPTPAAPETPAQPTG